MNRRLFLQSLGISFALPHLEIFGSETKSSAIKRVGVVYVPNGINMSQWTPNNVGVVNTLPSTLMPLKRHMDVTQIISGLTHDKARPNGDGAGDHARACATFLTGKQAKKSEGQIYVGKSFDQVLAEHYNGKTRFDSLQLSGDKSQVAGQCDSGYSCAYQYALSWKSPTQPLPSMNDPKQIFERLFKKDKLDEKTKLRRKSILDLVSEEANDLKKQLGNTDNRKLDEYLYSVREIEKQIDGIEKFYKDTNFELDFNVQNKSDSIRLMYKLMHLAYLTDSSRVVTYLTAHEGDNKPYVEIGIRDGHHDLSHHQNEEKKLIDLAKINHFQINLFSEFLDDMKKDNLLENTTIIYGGGISDGNRHNHDELPCILVGGKESGTHTRVNKEKPMCDLFMSIMHKHNIKVEQFGDSKGEFNVV